MNRIKRPTRAPWVILGVALVLLAAGILLAIPPIRARASYYWDEVRVKIRYAIRPPQEAVFVPQDVTPLPSATPSPTPTQMVTFTPTTTPQATNTPLPTATPLPVTVSLTGFRYMNQYGLWNYCAPANLAMALSFWGWEGDRLDTGHYLKPFEEDKNVMPYEMANYVEDMTNLAVVVRSGGTLDLLKLLIANGYPVLVEKGAMIVDYTGKLGWMGHYNYLTAYDDSAQQFLAQDSYFTPDYPVPYTTLEDEWLSFNNIFLVIYPPANQEQLFSLLGDYADSQRAEQIALETADNMTVTETGLRQFFAWFNRGTSLVRLQDYAGGAAAYDQAFELYNLLEPADRPFRMMWYQTGPYFAYYYTGRYQDVVDMVDILILRRVDKPYLEESWYWRAKAKVALGDVDGAIEDYRTALKYHPGFLPALQDLETLGVTP
jgi:tetratricopeptide (TPR) repeat protein